MLRGGGASRRRCLVAVVPGGGGQRAAGLQWETIAANNPFLLHVVVHVLQGVKAKVPFPPNSFSTMAEITPTTSLVVEIPETRVRRVV